MNLKRRSFLKASSGGMLGLMLPQIAELPAVAPADGIAKAGFSLKILATNWGFAGSMLAFCEKAKSEGYDGVELWYPMDPQGREELFHALEKTGLEVGFLCGTGETDPKAHFASFQKMVTEAVSPNHVRPLYINCHSGKDFFTPEQNAPLIAFTTKLSKETGIKILHETHRGRTLYAAPVARQYMEKHPDLRLTLDISHWCNVHESLLVDQPETVQMALSRTDHIHARVGHAEGPQVNDPRAPEWKDTVEAHFKWWDEVIRQKKAAGEAVTILTEFGPPNYLPALPYTQQPVADQWEINVYMMKTLRARYGR